MKNETNSKSSKRRRAWRIAEIIVGSILLVFTIFWGLHAGTTYNEDRHVDDPIGSLISGMIHLIGNPWDCGLYLNFEGISSMLCCLLVFGVVVVFWRLDDLRHRHFDSDIASGSAQWNDDLKAYNKKYTDPFDSKSNDGPTNMILTKNVKLAMDGRTTRKNNNICVIGGSGTGKSRFVIKPNILQANCNYVITDPAGELLQSTGAFLESQGYEVKVFNLVEMAKSDCYNPFNYIRDDLGVVMMIKCLIANTTPPGRKAGDPFWEKSEEALLQALCFYLVHHKEEQYRNFSQVMRLLRAAIAESSLPGAKTTLDRLFEDVEKEDPNSLAVKQYKTFKMGAEKTKQSILISCSVRLTVFNIQQIERLTGQDTLELEKMGEGKKALFVIIPSADSTYNFLVSMMYSQLFETLYYIAETQYDSKSLPRDIRFLLDEFANIGEIPEFSKKLATMRKYRISCTIILQNLAQLDFMYPDEWQTIMGNCDTLLFLGSKEYETAEYISKALGDTTIVVKNRTMSHGKNKSASQNYQITSRKLMTPDEITLLAEDECILMIRGLNPFKDCKYDYTNHPNYQYTGDYEPSFQYVNTRDNGNLLTIERVNVELDNIRISRYAGENPTQELFEAKKEISNLCKEYNCNTVKEIEASFIPLRHTPVISLLQHSIIENERMKIKEEGEMTKEILMEEGKVEEKEEEYIEFPEEEMACSDFE